jgi:hypothetical protein
MVGILNYVAWCALNRDQLIKLLKRAAMIRAAKAFTAGNNNILQPAAKNRSLWPSAIAWRQKLICLLTMMPITLPAKPNTDWENGTQYQISAQQTIPVIAPKARDAPPTLLLLKQLSIDAVIECDGVVHNSPLGRVGLDAWLIPFGARCVVRAKLPGAMTGSIVLSTVSLLTSAHGGDLSFWRTYTQSLMRDQEKVDVRAQTITVLRGLLNNEEISTTVKLSLNLAIAHLLRRDKAHAKALDFYARAAELSLAGQPERAPIFNGRGLSQLALGQHAQAKQSFEQAVSSARASHLQVDEAAAKNNLCMLLQSQDQIEAAGACYQDAAKLFDAASDTEYATIALSNWAFVAQRSGQADAALVALQSVLARRKASNKQEALARTYLKLSQLYQQTDRIDAALANAQNAISIFQQLGAKDALADSYRHYARILTQANQAARALSYLEMAVALKSDNPEVHGKLLADLAALMPRSQAWATRELAIRALANTKDSAYLFQLRLERVRDWITLGRLEQARSALDTLSAEDPRLLSQRARLAMAKAELHLADLKQHSKRSKPSTRMPSVITEPLKLYQRLRDHEDAFAASLLQVRWLQAHQQFLTADALLFASALSEAERLASAPSAAIASSMSARHRDWKDLWIQGASTREDKTNSWQALSRMQRMPIFVEQEPSPQTLRYQLLAAQLKSESSKASRAQQAAWLRELDQLDLEFARSSPAVEVDSLQAWQSWLAPQESLVRYVIGEQQSIALWLYQGRVAYQRLPGRVELQGLIESAKNNHQSALHLSETLLPNTYLATVVRLWVMPDEALHGVSFASLSSMRSTHSTQVPPTLSGVVTIAGDAIPNRRMLQTLPANFAVTALESYGPATLPGAARSKALLAKRLGARYQVLHWHAQQVITSNEVLFFAGHGWQNADFPSATVLSTVAPTAQSFTEHSNRMIVPLGQMRFAQKPRLIFLSACDAASVDAHGAGLSLARSLSQSHGSLVLAPIAPIDDALAMNFEQALFQALETLSPDQALLEALRSLAPEHRQTLLPWQIVLSAALGENATSRQ